MLYESSLEVHTSGLELWRLLRYNFDRASDWNVITILENIRNMQAEKNVQDWLPKIIASEERHHECVYGDGNTGRNCMETGAQTGA